MTATIYYPFAKHPLSPNRRKIRRVKGAPNRSFTFVFKKPVSATRLSALLGVRPMGPEKIIFSVFSQKLNRQRMVLYRYKDQFRLFVVDAHDDDLLLVLHKVIELQKRDLIYFVRKVVRKAPDA